MVAAKIEVAVAAPDPTKAADKIKTATKIKTGEEFSQVEVGVGAPGTHRTRQRVVVTAIIATVRILGTVWHQQHVLG